MGVAAQPEDEKPPYGVIRDLMKTGDVVPFLGAGVHLDNRSQPIFDEGFVPPFLPSGRELAECLAKDAEYPSDQYELAKVASFYVDNSARKVLRGRLRRVFNKLYGFHPSHDLHLRLAENPTPLLVVTTNYDDLMERALEQKKKPYHVVVHPTDQPEVENSVLVWYAGENTPKSVAPNDLLLDLDDKTWILYKIHGTVLCDHGERAKALLDAGKKPDRHDSFVITEEDYTDFLSRMARQQAVPAQFVRMFSERHFLFLGYGLGDWNFRLVLSNLRPHLPGRSWAIQFAPSNVERRLWDMRKVRIFNRSVTQFVKEMWPDDPPNA